MLAHENHDNDDHGVANVIMLMEIMIIMMEMMMMLAVMMILMICGSVIDCGKGRALTTAFCGFHKYDHHDDLMMILS